MRSIRTRLLGWAATALIAVPAVALADGNDTSPGNSGEHKVTICHHAGPTKVITITIDRMALPHHVEEHGDTIGPCRGGGGGGGAT